MTAFAFGAGCIALSDIGGLGIFMVKNSMDDMKYEHKDGQNVLTLIKKL